MPTEKPLYSAQTAKILVALLFMNVSFSMSAQTGNTFWFAAPDVSHEHYNNSVPLFLHVTASEATHVTITQPSGNQDFEISFDLSANKTKRVRLDSLLNIDEIEVYAKAILDAGFTQNKGFLIEASPGQVNVMYELGGLNNTEITVMKAENALGKNFWVSTQRKYKNHGYSDDFSGFVVVATEDNTVIEVDPMNNVLAMHGIEPFTVNLNKGQSFAMRAEGQAPEDHIFGVRVTSDKDIAISIFDDSMQIDDGGGNWDIFTDQLVPTELVGTEYIVVKGQVQDQPANLADGEAIFITATEENTDIFIDGMHYTNIVLPGEYLSYDIINPFTFVSASKPIYVNHITGYSTDVSGTRELGGAVLPPMDGCSGSYKVNFTRPEGPGLVLFTKLFARNDTVTGSPTRNKIIENFTYSINNSFMGPIPPEHFTYIMDSAYLVYDRWKAGGAAFFYNVIDRDVLTIENPLMPFQAGAVQARQSPGCRYGYYTNYGAPKVAAGAGDLYSPQHVACDLEPVQLLATGGLNYEWLTPYDPTLIDRLDDAHIPDPLFQPETEGAYRFDVVISALCHTDTLSVMVHVVESTTPEYTISDEVGCSGIEPIINNSTNTETGVYQKWFIEPAVGESYLINQDTIPRTFPLSFPENQSDTIQNHLITLTVKGIFNTCPRELTDTISILPTTYAASFNMANAQYCAEDHAIITNTTSGDHSKLSFQWFIDDTLFSTDETPSISLENYSDTLQEHIITLQAEGDSFCTQAFSQTLTVIPQITQAKFSLSDTSLCGGHALIATNETERAEQFKWYLDYTLYEQAINPDNELLLFPDNLTDSVETHTLMLKAISYGNYCENDTSLQFKVYPRLEASFSMKDTLFCGDNNPELVNTSSRVSDTASYFWYFDDNTYSTAQQPEKTFSNESDTLQAFNILLKINDAYCADSMRKTLTITPKISFTPMLSADGECTPAGIDMFLETASAVDSVFWWMISENDSSAYPKTSTETVHLLIDSLETPTETFMQYAIATNQFGCKDSAYLGELIIYQTPLVDFSAEPSPAETGDIVSFTNSTQYADAYTWYFGGSDYMYTEDAEYAFTTADTAEFSVWLTAFNGQCSDSAEQSIMVYPEATVSPNDIPLVNSPEIDFYYSNESLFIEWQGASSPVNYSVYDLAGNKILQNESRLQAGKNQIDNIILQAGIYLISLDTDNGIFCKKIIAY